MALMALVASAWLLGAALLGATDALGYLAPALRCFCALLAPGAIPASAPCARRLGHRRRRLDRVRSAPRRDALALARSRAAARCSPPGSPAAPHLRLPS